MDTTLNTLLLNEANQQLMRTNNALNAELTKMAAGKRVHEAAADAVDLVLGTFFNAEVASLQAAQRNAGDAGSMLDIANGAVDGAADLMIRAEELAIKANSSALSDDERAFIDAELDSIKTELDSLSSGTTFNGAPVFDRTLNFQLGSNASDAVTVETGEISADALGVENARVDTQSHAAAALGSLQAGLDQLLAASGPIRDTAVTLSHRSAFLGQNSVDVSAAGSRAQDADFAVLASSLSSLFIRQDAVTLVMSNAGDRLRSALSALI